MKQKILVTLAAAAAGAWVAAGCASTDPPPQSTRAAAEPGLGAGTSSAEPVAMGRALYAQNCADCHGASGKGDGKAGRDLDPAPTDLTGAEVAGLGEQALFNKISRGRKPMPAFRKLLSEEQRWQVVRYVRTLSPRVQEARTQ